MAIYCKYSFRLKTKQLNLPTTREFQANHPKSTPKTRTAPRKKNKKKHEKHFPPFSTNVSFHSSTQLHREPKVCSKVVVAPGDDMTTSSHGSKSTKGGTDLLHIIQLFLLKKKLIQPFFGIVEVQTFLSLTKYGIPKSLKVGHWLSEKKGG